MVYAVASCLSACLAVVYKQVASFSKYRARVRSPEVLRSSLDSFDVYNQADFKGLFLESMKALQNEIICFSYGYQTHFLILFRTQILCPEATISGTTFSDVFTDCKLETCIEIIVYYNFCAKLHCNESGSMHTARGMLLSTFFTSFPMILH